METKNMNENIEWWGLPENKTNIEIPVSIIESGKYWIVCANDETKNLLGDLAFISQGKTKEEAIERFFSNMNFTYCHYKNKSLSYERFVPFIKGPWGHIGGNWFTIFGINVYFRYGKGMKGGWYIPFTKLNIRIHSLWKSYRNYKKKLAESNKK